MRPSATAVSQVHTVSREGLGLILICLLDAALTVALITRGLATEANPLMASCLKLGVGLFYMVKVLPACALVLIAERHRKYNPEFVTKALRLGMVGYIILYTVGVLFTNAS